MSDHAPYSVGREGLQAVNPVYADADVQVLPFQLSRAEKLHTLTDQYTFFTDAAIDLNPWNIQLPVWRMFGSERKITPVVRTYTHDAPIFATGHRGYDHTLFAMEKGLFDEFRKLLGTLATYEEDQRIGLRIRYQDVEIPDPTDSLQNLPVTLFCLETTRGSWFFQIDPEKRGLPSLRLDKRLVYEDTIRYFQRWLAGKIA